MNVSNDKGNNLTLSLEKPIFKFQENEKSGGIPNEIFPLITMVSITIFDFSRILINDGSSYDMMYLNLIKNGLQKGKVMALRMVRPSCFQWHNNPPMEVRKVDGNLREQWYHDHWFIVPSLSLQKCIRLHPRTTLCNNAGGDGVSVHLKLKYHNMHGEAVTINVNLYGANIIY